MAAAAVVVVIGKLLQKKTLQCIRNPLGGSLHTQLVALVMAISVLSIAVLGVISIDIGQRVLKDDAAQRLNLIASDRMQTLKSIWNLRVEQVESLARNPTIMSLLLRSEMPGEAAGSESQLESAAAKETIANFEAMTKGRDTSYIEVQIANAAGQILVSAAGDQSPQGEGRGGQNGATLSQDVIARAAQRAFYTIEFDEGRGEAVLMAVAPVRAPSELSSSSSSSVAGYVVLVRDLNVINRILADKMFLGKTGETYLVNGDGLMITDSRFMAGARHNQLLLLDTPPVQECFRNSADVNGASYPNYRGTIVFGASSCEKDLGIVLVSEVGSTELFAPLVVLQSQYLLITAAIIVAAAAASFFLSLSILKPLQSLRKTMGRVQTGRFEKVDIVRRDEIGELAASFNTMVEEIGIKTKKLHLKNDILSFMSSRLQVQADELVKADREKEEFSEMISHELKTFLSPIIGYSELLLDGTFGEINPAQKNQLRVVLEKAWSLLYLTQNMIDARQLEYGVMKMSVSSQVSAKKLVEECVGRSLPVAKSRGVRLLISKADDVMFNCDPQRILQVLDNLVNNAIKALPDGERRTEALVEISAVAAKGQKAKEGRDKEGGSSDNDDGHDQAIVFSVRDNGVGIPEDKQRDLFKKFYQVDKSLTREAGGRGLGLVISKGIVQAHNGKIWFESKPGEGSTFHFSIPLGLDQSRRL